MDIQRVPHRHMYRQAYDFSQSVGIENVKFDFGNKMTAEGSNVDQTLATLFDTLTVECSGILVQPQWKHFKHIRMLKNDRYRLSNGIWRSWHMQFQKSKKPLYCLFDIDASLMHHRRQAAVVLEGKYWKRKVSAVATEYRKWRIFHKEKSKSRKLDPSMRAVQARGRMLFADMRLNFKSKAMQVDPSKPPLFLQGLDAIPESIFPNFSKDSPDAIATMDFMIQQPNLEVLNPTTLDDFLDRMEPMEVMLSQVVNSTFGFNQSSLSAPVNPLTGAPSSTTPYATPTPAQPSLNDSQFSGSDYSNASFMGGYATPTATPTNQQQQQPPPQQSQPNQAQGFPLSPTVYLSTEEKGDKRVGGANLPGMPGANMPMKNEPSLEGVGFPGQQDMYGSYAQPSMVPSQEYGAINRTDVTSPGANYSMALKDEASMGTMGQFLNQFLTDPLNPAHVPSQPLSGASQCYQPSGGNESQQQGLPSSSMFQFPTSPLQPGQQFESNPVVGPLPPSDMMQQQQQQSSATSPNQHSMFRVSSAGNLGMITDEPTAAPSRPPLARGKSEPIRHLQQQVKHLAEENERQMMEIEKQQSIAEQQYVAVLQQLAEQQVSGKASPQQQEVLKSVLSDPSLVSILRNILLAHPPPVSLLEKEERQQRSRVQPLSITPSKMSNDSGTHLSSTPSPLISPSQSHMYGFSMGATSMPATPSAPGGTSKSIQLGEVDSLMSLQAQKKLKSSRHMSSEEKEVFKEIRRQSHISAEQKRRGSIKHGFSQLQSMVVNTASYPSGKVSKATILEKSIEHIQHVLVERSEREKQIESFKRQIEELNASIAQCQEQLPASGVPITRQRFEENRQRFREYTQRRTLQNYKFWVFALVLRQLFESYNSMVSTGSVDELCRTVLAWFEQYCTLPALRPIVMDSLREISQRTSILTDPSQVPHQLAQFAQQSIQQQQHQQQPQHRLAKPTGIFN